jgi:hypothetical protein
LVEQLHAAGNVEAAIIGKILTGEPGIIV